jgi:hypothetical protein
MAKDYIMRTTINLEANATYRVSKQIIPNNQHLTLTEVEWITQELTRNLRRILLPVGDVLAFSVTRNRIEYVIRFYSEEIIRKTPREVRHLSQILSVSEREEYLNGMEICKQDKPNCQGISVHSILKKKCANFLQSYGRLYNRKFNRTDRLSGRLCNFQKLETNLTIQNAIQLVQNAPKEAGEYIDLRICSTSSVNESSAVFQTCINYPMVREILLGEIPKVRKKSFPISLKSKHTKEKTSGKMVKKQNKSRQKVDERM